MPGRPAPSQTVTGVIAGSERAWMLPRVCFNAGMPTTTRIVRIGNSRGIRIPKALLELAGLSDEVELHAEPGRLVVRATRRPRDGWEAAAQEMRAAGDDLLLDPPRPTAFDGEEWEWRPTS